MGNNVPLTPGSGINIAADEIAALGPAQVEYVKIMDATEDSVNRLIVETNGAVNTRPGKSTALQAGYNSSNVAIGTGASTIVASNPNRMQLAITNNSLYNVYIRPGSAATTGSYLVKLAPGDYYELGNGGFIYTGIIWGTSDNANGSVLVTEFI
jgi:hypothetical protein